MKELLRILNLISRVLSSKNDEDYRSAGACPPLTLHSEGQALALRVGMPFFFVARGPVPRDRSARDNPGEGQPSPYGESGGVSL